MATKRVKALRVNPIEETTAYRQAVRDIITNIEREFGETHIDIAESIGVCVGTISNASNKTVNLNPLYLNRLGQVYGAEFLNPFMELSDGVAQSRASGDIDPLPAVSLAVFKLCEIRSPSSEGGATETPSEQSRVLADLESARDDLTAKIVSIKRRLSA